MATLIIMHGPASGQQFALGEHRLVMIGRDNECTFQIVDQQMSRRHMQIKRCGDAGGHAAIDFGSANGVFINGQRVKEETPLRDGDEIRIGESNLIYTVSDSPDAKTINGLLRKRGEHVNKTIMNNPSRE